MALEMLPAVFRPLLRGKKKKSIKEVRLREETDLDTNEKRNETRRKKEQKMGDFWQAQKRGVFNMEGEKNRGF